MLTSSTILTYPLLLILSNGKRSFQNLGRLIAKSGDTIKRYLRSSSLSMELMVQLANTMFLKKRHLVLVVDDTSIRKIYSRFMEGSGRFYDTKIGRSITAYRLIAAIITDGRFVMPINCAFMFAKELVSESGKIKSKEDFFKEFVKNAIKVFPDKKIRVAADGFYSSINIIKWCLDNNIECEMRMHKNRRVEYNGKSVVISEIKKLIPVGRQMAKTIKVIWHEMRVYITAVKRIDKHNIESIVYQVSTYHASPDEHAQTYKKRWGVEKVFRTIKQYLGLEECFSRKLESHSDHVTAVFVAYSIAQLEMRKRKLDTPEDALRALKFKKYNALEHRLSALHQIFNVAHA